jgi:hypothetical protein
MIKNKHFSYQIVGPASLPEVGVAPAVAGNSARRPSVFLAALATRDGNDWSVIFSDAEEDEDESAAVRTNLKNKSGFLSIRTEGKGGVTFFEIWAPPDYVALGRG